MFLPVLDSLSETVAGQNCGESVCQILQCGQVEVLADGGRAVPQKKNPKISDKSIPGCRFTTEIGHHPSDHQILHFPFSKNVFEICSMKSAVAVFGDDDSIRFCLQLRQQAGFVTSLDDQIQPPFAQGPSLLFHGVTVLREKERNALIFCRCDQAFEID